MGRVTRKDIGMSGIRSESAGETAAVHEVVRLEEAALRRRLAGDPGGFLDISADDVVYFVPSFRVASMACRR